jgi:tetratricopeptide (TPR) repeat protein
MMMQLQAIPRPRVAVALTALLLAPACAMRAQLGMEAPGRPAVSWQSSSGGAAKASEVRPGQDTEAELLAELREAERTGTDNLALANTLYNLAILRREQGDFAEAEQLYRRVLETREREEGPSHPDVAATLNNLAGLEAARGNYDVAQPLLERALSIRQTALGTEHALTAQSLNNLALLYAAQGNAAAAEPLYQRALSILEKAEAPQQDDLGRVLDNYAALLHDTGREAEAGDLDARARVIRGAAGR